MDTPKDIPVREDPSITPDKKNNELASSENMEQPSHQGGTISGASNGYPQVIPPHESPQQPNYYGTYGNSQVTPESPSPNSRNNGGSFFPAPMGAGFQSSPFTNDATHAYSGAPSSQQPSSPTQSMGGIPPASPLFPRMTGPMPAMPTYLNTSRGGDTAVSQGMSPVPSVYTSSGGMYIPGSYPILAGRPNGSSNNNNSSTMNSNNASEEFMGWNDNR